MSLSFNYNYDYRSGLSILAKFINQVKDLKSFIETNFKFAHPLKVVPQLAQPPS